MDETILSNRLRRSIWPKVIGAVVTARDGRVNLCPVTFQEVSSAWETPLSVCIGLNNANYTLETILEAQEFVHAHPSRAQLRDIVYCGTVSGRDTDKLARTSLQFAASSTVAAPRLIDAVVNIECKLARYHRVGDFTIVQARILDVEESRRPTLDKILVFEDEQFGCIDGFEILQSGRGG